MSKETKQNKEIEISPTTRNAFLVERQNILNIQNQLKMANDRFSNLVNVYLDANKIKIDENLKWEISEDYKKIHILND